MLVVVIVLLFLIRNKDENKDLYVKSDGVYEYESDIDFFSDYFKVCFRWDKLEVICKWRKKEV